MTMTLDRDARIADLERLAAELGPRGCKTVLVTSDGGMPTLDVLNGEFPEVSGRVCASGGHFQWSGAGVIARRDEIPAAVQAISRAVLVSGEMP